MTTIPDFWIREESFLFRPPLASPDKARGEHKHMFIMNIETGAAKLINPGLPGNPFFQQYIAEKKEILLVLPLKGQGNTEIFVMDEDGRNARNLTNKRAYDGAPCI